MQNKCYSLCDDEGFTDNLPEGLAAGEVYYEAIAIAVNPEKYIPIDSILESIDDNLYEDLGECYGNDASNASAEAVEELRTFLVGWLAKNTNISKYFVVKDVVEKVFEL